MVRDLLLDIVNKWRILDIVLLLLLFISFLLIWYISIILGLKLLNVKVKFKHTILGTFVGAFISLFIKPFIPDILAFFFTLIPLIIFIRRYSKTKWYLALWVSFITLLASSVGPMLFINPISSVNRNIGAFFFSRYGLPVMGLTEAFGVVLLLGLLNIFDISLVPDPKQPLKTIELVAVCVLLFISLLGYNFTVDIWKSWKNSMKLSTDLLIKWTLAAAAIIGFSIYKSYTRKREKEYQKKIEAQDNKIQELIELNLKNQQNTNSINYTKTNINRPELELRERKIIKSIIEGKSNKEIAADLHLSKTRVDNLVTPIYKKLEVDDHKISG